MTLLIETLQTGCQADNNRAKEKLRIKSLKFRPVLKFRLVQMSASSEASKDCRFSRARGLAEAAQLGYSACAKGFGCTDPRSCQISEVVFPIDLALFNDSGLCAHFTEALRVFQVSGNAFFRLGG